MSGTRSAITARRAEGAAANSDARVEQLLRRQRTLAWLLSILTLIVTVVFFAMTTLAAPLMAQVVFGHSVTIANVAAVFSILLFLVLIAVFGQRAERIDERLRDTGNEHA